MSLGKIKILNKNHLSVLASIFFLMLILFFITSFTKQRNLENKNNLESITKSNEFSNLTDYFFSKINSPYKEESYVIKNNDTIEKILKSFNIRNIDIKKISINLRRKNLSSIYSGRKLSIIYKKLDDGSNAVINLLFPISNTNSIEVRRSQDNFFIKENILKLYKKEVVVKKSIKNNLYNAAVNAKIEPNIIIEFARIFGFEVDFQRDVRKNDWFEIYYEKFIDDYG